MKIQVLGAGGWGIALARHLGRAGNTVSLWGRSLAKQARLAREREERDLLPGVTLPPEVTVADIPCPNPDLVVYAVPSHALRQTLEQFDFPRHSVRVSAAKGIENGTLLRMTQLISLFAPHAPVATLSGPSHAEEVGRDLPVCLVAASEDEETRATVQRVFGTAMFRVYTSRDVIGVELGGALKNVIAIAAGACEGFGLGDNAKAALITRGLVEMTRLGVALGAEASTFAGLGGLGDLVVTCASRHSRNHRVGRAIASGKSLAEILASTTQVAEGIRASTSAMQLAARHGVDMPIAGAVHGVLFDNNDPREAIVSLMTRLMKAEWE